MASTAAGDGSVLSDDNGPPDQEPSLQQSILENNENANSSSQERGDVAVDMNTYQQYDEQQLTEQRDEDADAGRRLFHSQSPASTRSMKDIAGGGADSNGTDGPMLSILNVVVDHVMVPPCPLEVEEFDIFCRQLRRKQIEEKNKKEEDTLDNNIDDRDMCTTDINAETSASISHQHLLQQPSQSEEGASPFPSPTPPLPNERILVPVLRFFGPVIRGDPAKVRSLPRQSGCLHVHGAYPYLLARPIVAGPDGSSYRRSGDAVSSQVDWDNPDSVSCIVDEIHAKLEGALRASQEWKAKRDTLGGADRGGKDEATEEQSAQNHQLPLRYIRQVSVVTGRGFYTYCSGPPAPFLRIEYYDPKTKWKVKLMLERGLDVEEAYHPDARFYDYGDGDGGSKTNDSVEDDGIEERHSCPPLKFRCYEAHIPYTMQVFKDLNLSGMSYVKIRSGMFRQSLPKKERERTLRSSFLNGDDLFLEHNVLDQSKWDAAVTSESRISSQVEAYPSGTSLGTAGSSPLPTKNSERTPQQYRHGAFLSQSSSSAVDIKHPTSCPSESKSASRLPHSCPSDMPIEDQYWTTKETLCDVEVDTTVNELLNVKDVMTSLPDDPSERARVHWRAVPSLREIWELERSRMASLVTKEEDFLNSASDNQSTPPLTLTANGWRIGSWCRARFERS